MRRTVSLLLFTVLVVFAAAPTVGAGGAQSPPQDAGNDTIAALRERVEQIDEKDLSPQAVSLMQRYLDAARREKGEASIEFAGAADWLASLHNDRGEYAEAEPLFRQALKVRELSGASDPDKLAGAQIALAGNLQLQGRFDEAEALYKQTLALEPKLGASSKRLIAALNNLASMYVDLGRFGEAEPLLKRSVELREASEGPDSAALASQLNNVATFYERQGLYQPAEQYHLRAFAIREKVLGPDDLAVGNSLNNLAALYAQTNRMTQAATAIERAAAIYEKNLGPRHPLLATVLGVRGSILMRTGDYTAAETVWQRVLDIRKASLPADHPDIAAATSELGLLQLTRGNVAKGEALLKDALAGYERAYGPTHPAVALANDNLAYMNFLLSKWPEAVRYGRAGTAVSIRRAERIANNVGQPLTGEQVSDFDRFNDRTERFVKSAFQLALADPAQGSQLAQEAFELAQWGRYSKAAQSLNQMAARAAAGDPTLVRLVRERQDLTQQWNVREAKRTTFAIQPAPERDKPAEAANKAELSALEAKISAIDKTLLERFPDYAAVATPKPLSLGETQSLLRDDEALVFFFDTAAALPLGEETFVWLISRNEVKWRVLYLGTPLLAKEVNALRCGLDDAAWQGAGLTNCNELLQKNLHEPPRTAVELPFDHARAHALYKSIFGDVDDVIRDKQLLLVPAGSLTQLPFQVLVTKPPMPGDNNRNVAWLVREHALSVLPAVPSLKALRRLSKPSAAQRPMIGFGNPLLDGDQRDPQFGPTFARLAADARAAEHCPSGPPQQVASAGGALSRGLEPISSTGRTVSSDHLRRQIPLPETADELCAVARDLKADPDEIRLGANAMESVVKSMSEAGQLSDYRIVHFATHGALAGQVSGSAEPGLILTPPTTPSNEDDGYLSASEIASLKLDADWVILSACNTAGPSGASDGAEALSGLARAFFYAQARALLVSHWAVDSNATVKLITVTARALDTKTGRAQALQKAILTMIDSGTGAETHPSAWAPFVVVGEGGTADAR